MENQSNDYHISFFKPTTPQAKANRNMVIWLVSIWFIAIFGFHFLMKIIEKPIPEPVYGTFTTAWESIQNGSASDNEIADFGTATLTVLSKVMISATDKTSLNNALSWSAYKLTKDSLKADLVSQIKEFERLKTSTDDISNNKYVEAKIALSQSLAPLYGIPANDVRAKIMPIELKSEGIETLTEETLANLPGIMKKYLIHNRSFLTDFRFLGFPFHYFYTAVFLLILFVGLCWLYCKKTDMLNAKFNIVD